MNKKIIALSALALSMSFSQATFACDGLCGDHKSYMAGERYQKMTEKLDLTADQKSKIMAIGTKAREDMKPKLEEMRSIHMQLNKLAGEKVLDQGKIDTLVNQKKDIVGAVTQMRITTRHDIDMVLTAPQKAKLDAMVMKWEGTHMEKSCDKS